VEKHCSPPSAHGYMPAIVKYGSVDRVSDTSLTNVGKKPARRKFHALNSPETNVFQSQTTEPCTLLGLSRPRGAAISEDYRQ